MIEDARTKSKPPTLRWAHDGEQFNYGVFPDGLLISGTEKGAGQFDGWRLVETIPRPAVIAEPVDLDDIARACEHSAYYACQGEHVWEYNSEAFIAAIRAVLEEFLA
jgi:hypothetical protein